MVCHRATVTIKSKGTTIEITGIDYSVVQESRYILQLYYESEEINENSNDSSMEPFETCRPISPESGEVVGDDQASNTTLRNETIESMPTVVNHVPSTEDVLCPSDPNFATTNDDCPGSTDSGVHEDMFPQNLSIEIKSEMISDDEYETPLTIKGIGSLNFEKKVSTEFSGEKDPLDFEGGEGDQVSIKQELLVKSLRQESTSDNDGEDIDSDLLGIVAGLDMQFDDDDVNDGIFRNSVDVKREPVLLPAIMKQDIDDGHGDCEWIGETETNDVAEILADQYLCFCCLELVYIHDKLKHNRSHKPNDVRCYFCHEKFKSIAGLQSHLKGKAHRRLYTLDHPVPHEAVSKIARNKPKRFMSVSHFCDKCCTTFASKASLTSHNKIHAKKGEQIGLTFRCDECDTHFSSSISLRVHQRKHAMKSKRESNSQPVVYPCDECNVTFATSVSLTFHKRNHALIAVAERYSCNECSATFTTINSLRLHKKKHALKATAKVYSCIKCNINFPSSESLAFHEKEHLIKGAVFNRNGIRIRHWCRECNLIYPTRESLSEHKQEHSIKCSICDKRFYKEYLREVHMAKHENDVAASRNVDESLPVKVSEKLTHTSDSNSRPTNVSTNLEKLVLRCGFCSVKFKNKRQYSLHVACHNKMNYLECAICLQVFKNKPSLNSHHVKYHSDSNLVSSNPSHSRPHDQNTTISKSVASELIRIPVIPEAPVIREFLKCASCSEIHMSKELLANHYCAQHTNIVLLSCDICQLLILTKDEWKTHFLVHMS